MFDSCSNLKSIPTKISTLKFGNIDSMFESCKSLTFVKLDTSNAVMASNVFKSCEKLQTIDITRIPKSNFSYLCRNCYSLTKIIVRTMDTIPAFGSDMFGSCYHFTGTQNETYNPDGLKDGRIYVPDDKVEELKAASGWSDFADIIVPLSTLEE